MDAPRRNRDPLSSPPAKRRGRPLAGYCTVKIVQRFPPLPFFSNIISVFFETFIGEKGEKVFFRSRKSFPPAFFIEGEGKKLEWSVCYEGLLVCYSPVSKIGRIIFEVITSCLKFVIRGVFFTRCFRRFSFF